MSAPKLDPVTFSVVLHQLDSIVDEMTITMEKTAYTSIIALARDYTCAIYDSVPRQICMFEGLPIHANSMHLVLEEIARTFEGDICDGDVFACNHPFRQNTHVGDLVTAVPVFVDDRHAFWSVTKGHQQDVGAFIPSSIAVPARDVWQEGLHIPPIKIHEAGLPREDVIDLYLANVRYPELLTGDLLAQLASIERGRLRLLDLVREHGLEEVERYVDAIIDYADRRMSEQIRAMPDGEYRGEAWVDSDGAEALDVPVKACVTIDGPSVKVDFDGSGPQSPRGVNGSEACLQAATAIPFMNMVDADIPKNHGCIRHIEATAPEGTICKAKYPASTTSATITPANQIYDSIQKAMVEATPDRVVAGGAPSNNQPDFSGVDQTTGRAWGVLFFNNMGGQGAAKGVDGWPIWGSATGMGGLKSLSIEELELLYPMDILQMEIEQDSVGFGTWLGGPGNRLAARPTRGPMECTSFGSGYRNPPHGVLGGMPGVGGRPVHREPADRPAPIRLGDGTRADRDGRALGWRLDRWWRLRQSDRTRSRKRAARRSRRADQP